MQHTDASDYHEAYQGQYLQSQSELISSVSDIHLTLTSQHLEHQPNPVEQEQNAA